MLAGLGLMLGPSAEGVGQPAPDLSGRDRVGTEVAIPDPQVRECRRLAARRAHPEIEDSVTAKVDLAAGVFDLDVVFDAVANCRAALAAYPQDRGLIIAANNAEEALAMLVLGLKFPDAEEARFEQALRAADKEAGSAFGKRMFGFFLGSAYEHGVGTQPDVTAAMKWYAIAADAGEPISQRELTRLQNLQRPAPEPQ